MGCCRPIYYTFFYFNDVTRHTCNLNMRSLSTRCSHKDGTKKKKKCMYLFYLQALWYSNLKWEIHNKANVILHLYTRV